MDAQRVFVIIKNNGEVVTSNDTVLTERERIYLQTLGGLLIERSRELEYEE